MNDKKDYVTNAKKDSKPRVPDTYVGGVRISAINDPYVTYYYDKNGKETMDEVFCFAALRKFDSGKTKYFAKIAVAGPNTGRLLDVKGGFYIEGDEKKYETRLGKYRYELKEVNQTVFEGYKNFLETGNSRHLDSAQRAIANG